MIKQFFFRNFSFSFNHQFIKQFFAKLLTGAILVGLVTHCAIANNAPRVAMNTTMGTIVLELYPDKAPKTVANFLQYVKEGHYDGTIFHRVIDGFMIQGGGFDQDMQQKSTHEPIENEAQNGLKNAPYTIAMARNNEPHSATSQFFINVENNQALDYPGQDGWGYCVFGKVIEGMDVVDKIKRVNTSSRMMHQNVPMKPIFISSASVIE